MIEVITKHYKSRTSRWSSAFFPTLATVGAEGQLNPLRFTPFSLVLTQGFSEGAAQR
jgi:hypothetical protein